MRKAIQSSGGKRFINGYVDDARLAGPNHLAPPSINSDITKTGEAVYSKGTIPVSFDLNNAGKPSRPFHCPRYNVTFFAINGKVLFVNHNNSDAVVDTGITLTNTNGRQTRFAEFAGDIFLTNSTDGLRQIHMGRLNDAAATAGDATITIDTELAGRLIGFGDDTSTINFATNSPFSETVTSTSAAGVVTLTGTLNTDVADDTIVWTVEDISSGRPKGSGITFWKNRMIIWGVVSDTGYDNISNTVFMSSFYRLSSTDMPNIIQFSGGTSAAEPIGGGGAITAVLSTRDYLYYFTEKQTFFSSTADVLETGTGAGAMFPQLLSTQYGCANEDCAIDVGNGLCIFLTKEKRIIGIRTSSQSGAPVVFPDEKFDSPLSNTVALLDTDQSDSFFFYAPNDHRAYMHVNVGGERIVLKYNTEIQVIEPPRTGWVFGGMYVKDGVTFAVDLNDDDVYQLNEGYQNNGFDYEKIIATCLVEDQDGRTTLKLDSVGVSGRASDLSDITAENYVGVGTTPQQKTFTVSTGASAGAIGSVTIGTVTLGEGSAPDMIEYDKLFAIYPTYGSSYQLVMRSTGAFTVSSYSVYGSALASSLLTLQ